MLTIALLVLAVLSQANGHGYMAYPVPWHNSLGYGLTLGQLPDPAWSMDFDGVDYPPDYLPEEKCEGGKPPCMENWMYESGVNEAFTNYTFIPGEPTLPDNMYDVRDEDELQQWKDSKHPWTSPGSSPVFGNGCGASGGAPFGCLCQDDTPLNNCFGDDTRPYGSCCGAPNAEGNPQCSGYTRGLNVTEHAANGIYDGAAITLWERGSSAAVIWKSGAKHRGGYAYRLCKLGKDGYAGLTEECFQDGHLKFDGEYNWLQVLSGDEVVTTIRQTAIRNTKGTTPEGSEWTTWHYTTINDAYPGDQTWGWKDMVQVPDSLEPGSYVLSFRWDCQITPQIWQTCANVEII